MAADQISQLATQHGTAYVFDNSGEQAKERFSALAAVFDAGTKRHLEALGIQEGWRCLEVGAGGGSIACWLCDRVGESGYVLATDIDTRFLAGLSRPNLEVRTHNVVSDPLPEESWDLLHARLVLSHLAEREKVLEGIYRALKPGGWALVEDVDALSLLPDPEASPGEVYLKTYRVIHEVMVQRGVHLRFGRVLPERARARGFVEVGAEGRVFLWQGGSPGARLLRANFEQLHDAMIHSGMLTEREFQDDVARLLDPEFTTPSFILWAVWARRPPA